MRISLSLLLVIAGTSLATAKPVERRLHSDNIDASTFLWNDWNKFVENYHPNYVADDDPKTAWVEGAKSSGAGEWIKIQLTPLDKTTRVRIRVRNGYQKAKDLWQANARAKQVTVRLLPSKVEKKLTLEDKDGWQDVIVDQPSGAIRSVELAVASVYEGSKYADLAISDVQVFATSETPDNPAFEKSKHETLMGWRTARVSAAKLFKGKVGMPIAPAYEIVATDRKDVGGYEINEIIAEAQKEPGLAKEWKDALAIAAAVAKDKDKLTRAQIAAKGTKLVEVDGIQITEVGDVETGEGPYYDEGALRLPMLGTVPALFSDQLRALDIKDKLTVSKFEQGKNLCKDTAWVQRSDSKEGPAKVAALVLGRCARVEGRGGAWNAHTIEIMVYDTQGRLALVAGNGHVDAYRWATEEGKQVLVGGRAILLQGKVIEAKRREAVATK